jgi:hypothetical protein
MKRKTRDLPTTGDREGLRLDFKRAEKLRTNEQRQDLVRTIVAMRNAKGGTIWVGCEEKNGQWTGFDPLMDGDHKHRDALRNQIVGSIEPLVRPGSVSLEEVQVPNGWLLRIGIRELGADSAPCCVRLGNQREFLRRFEDQNTLIPYPDLRGQPAEAHVDPVNVLKLLQERAREVPSKPCLVFLFAPDGGRADPDFLSRMHGLLVAPDKTLDPVPGMGWHGGRWGPTKMEANAQMKSGRLQCGRPDLDYPYRVTTLDRDGTLFFYSALPWFPSGPLRKPDREPLWVSEAAITTTIVSLIRLARRVVSEVGDIERVAFVASIRNALTWKLGIVSQPSIRPCEIESRETTSDVLVRSREELLEAPDSIAADVLRSLYSCVVISNQGELRATDFPWFQADGTFAPPQ